jgi:hypothetical protein
MRTKVYDVTRQMFFLLAAIGFFTCGYQASLGQNCHQNCTNIYKEGFKFVLTNVCKEFENEDCFRCSTSANWCKKTPNFYPKCKEDPTRTVRYRDCINCTLLCEQHTLDHQEADCTGDGEYTSHPQGQKVWFCQPDQAPTSP